MALQEDWLHQSEQCNGFPCREQKLFFTNYCSLMFATAGGVGERWQQKAWCHCWADVMVFMVKHDCQTFCGCVLQTASS